ncbi:ketopantoate reductase family protein [Marinobacterium sp. YM272]|uniref:ketopantoate reductase family protein n=1 Tax=Marinobacterium sp. YM272 TaxID=3421654 RepID=UPI003D7F90A6
MNDVMILGAGALGSYIGGMLSQSGCSVQLVNRSAETAAVIKRDGLTLENDQGKVQTYPSAATPDQATAARYVLLFTKTYQSMAAIQSVLNKLSPDSVLVTLQNGLANGERLAACTDLPIVQGVTMIPATLVKPGVVRSKGFSDTWMGPLNLRSAIESQAARDLADMFVTAGLTAEYQENVAPKIWQKACFNVAMNAICALSDGSPGLVNDTPELKSQAHALADEAVAVATASGVAVDEQALHSLIDSACQEHRFHQPSMLQDIRAQRPTEIGSLNGFIVARANELGISVPKNELIAGLVLARERAPIFWNGQ